MPKHILHTAQVEVKHREDVASEVFVGYQGLEVYIRLSPFFPWIVIAELLTARRVRKTGTISYVFGKISVSNIETHADLRIKQFINLYTFSNQ